MKRSFVLAIVGTLSLAVVVAQDTTKVIDVEQLENNLFVLRGEGGGGNTAVFITTDGVVVVDTKNPGWGQPILEQIKALTSNPVTTLINTHSHADHISGNVAFATTVEFVAHETTKANMEAMRPYTGRTEPPVNVFADTNGRGLPTKTFTDRMSLGSGADQVDLYYFGRAHTGGDAWVVFPSLRTLHAGDAFLGKRVPFLDAANGGSGVAIPDTLQMAHDTIRNVDTIITGHSTQATWELNEWAAFNRDFLEMVRAGRSAGRTVDEIASWTMPTKSRSADATFFGEGCIQNPCASGVGQRAGQSMRSRATGRCRRSMSATIPPTRLGSNATSRSSSTNSRASIQNPCGAWCGLLILWSSVWSLNGLFVEPHFYERTVFLGKSGEPPRNRTGNLQIKSLVQSGSGEVIPRL